MEKISLPKGTRDFGPEQMAKRQFIIDSIKKVFQRYGFMPLETPAMENLSTLQGKYGDEGDKLLFRILDSGEYFEKLKLISKDISNLDHTPIKVGKLVQLLYEVLWNLGNLIHEKYPEAEEKFPWTGGISDDIRVSFLSVGEIEKLFANLNASESQKREVSIFLRQEYIYLPAKAIEARQRLKGLELTKENFIKTLNDSRGEDIREFISDFDVEYSLNLKLEQLTSKDVTPFITEKGLRYDLTVPFARYVVMNRHEIVFPFKRYQIQPVWRADRPQKGRYREFYQCDADVVGTDSLVCEAEIILMIKDAFKTLGINDYSIKINHRGILSGLAEMLNASDNENSLFVAIDKLDKIGEEKVKEELKGRGFDENSLPQLFEVLNFAGNTKQKIDFLSQKFSTSEKGKKGLADMKEVFSLIKKFGSTDEHVEFDIALARGLSYYTGCIFEVKINNVSIGSVSGGGRYDNLTAVFDAKEKSSGVGFSFGIDRLYDAMEELQVFPKETTAASTILVAHLDDDGFQYAIKTVQAFRERDISCEIYPDRVKIKKQMEYADRKKIPFVVVIGSEEVQSEMLTLKKMETGNQLKLTFDEIATAIQLYTKDKI